MNTRSTTMLAVLMMLFSSMAGCLDSEDDDEWTAMVSTYHVGQLVSAIGGDTIKVEMISTSGVPVHDYEPAAADIVRLQESDIFFYHGLNLEPWVESALESLGDQAPTSIQTHAMPTGETAIDFESMLISDLCDLLTNGPLESTTLGHDDHEDSHDDDNDSHDNHSEEDSHEGHNHAEAEETIENPENCPADTVISIFHMEEGEHVLEFEEDHNEDFNMAVLKMPGGHAHGHHDHGHGAGAFEWAGIFSINDASHTWSMQKVDGEYADPTMRLVLVPTSTPDEETMHSLEDGVEALIEGDCSVVEDGEAMQSIQSTGSCFELHVGTGDDSTFTIDTSDISGLAMFAQHVPTEFERDQHYLKDSTGGDIEPNAQEGADAHAHDEHDEDEHGDDDHHDAVCHNTITHENYNSTESDCEAAGHVWMEDDDHAGVCHNTTTHENYDSTESDCEAAGHVWMEEEHHEYPEIHADYNAHSLSFPDEMVCYDMSTHTVNGSLASQADCEAAGLMWTAADSGPGDDDHSDEEGHHEAGYVVVHIEEEGDYGFAVPKDVEFHILADAPKAFEWAGAFSISDNSHTWSMQAVAGEDGTLAYADPSMRLVLVPTDSPTEEAIHSSESGVEAMIEGDSCAVVEDGESMTSIAAGGSCFELHVGTGDDSTYTIDTTGLAGVVVYAQHVPTEFERDQHYLKDSSGEDIEPNAQESSGAHDHGHHDEHGDEEGEIEAGEGEAEFDYDPHSWLDPLAFKAQAQVVLEALKDAYPSGESDFTSNAESYMLELDNLHADFQSNLPSSSTCTDTKVIANHNAYSYMAKRYDLKFISIHGLDPEGEPAAADIAEAVEEINEEGITVLFVEEYTSISAVDSIVEQTVSETMPNGVTVEYLYTMELPPKDSTDDYISLMRKSMDSLKTGLGC